MPKFRYVGKEPIILAQVGPVNPDEIIEVNNKIAEGLISHGADQFEPMASGTKGKAPAPKEPEPADPGDNAGDSKKA